MTGKGHQLTALLISPDRGLAEQFLKSAEQSRVFQVASELKTYPNAQTLEMRLRQARPDVVLVDLATDIDQGCEVIRAAALGEPPVQVVGLHHMNDANAVLKSLRMGAIEFLHAPFDPAVQKEAGIRLRRLLQPDPIAEAVPGVVVAFTSAKPGSGSSTLAVQTAFALRRNTGKRVLLADFDLMGGMIGFSLKLNPRRSVLDALTGADQLDDTLWSSLVANCDGVDVLSAPDVPFTGPVDPARLHAVLEYARVNYDWIVIDLPVAFQRLSLIAISESDRSFLIATSELPALHLARKGVNLLTQLGFPRERFQILMNRVNKRDEIATADMEKLFNCAVHSRFPNDIFSLNRALTLGQPLEMHSELGKAIDALVGKLAAGNETGAAKKAGIAEGKAQLSYA